MHAILKLENKLNKFLFSANINGMDIEIDSGAYWVYSTLFIVPNEICKLVPTNVTLKRQFSVTVQVLDQKFCGMMHMKN